MNPVLPMTEGAADHAPHKWVYESEPMLQLTLIGPNKKTVDLLAKPLQDLVERLMREHWLSEVIVDAIDLINTSSLSPIVYGGERTVDNCRELLEEVDEILRRPWREDP